MNNEGLIIGLAYIILAGLFIIITIWYEVITIKKFFFKNGLFKIYQDSENYYFAKAYCGKILWLFPVWIKVSTTETDTGFLKLWANKEKLIKYLNIQFKKYNEKHNNPKLTETINLKKK